MPVASIARHSEECKFINEVTVRMVASPEVRYISAASVIILLEKNYTLATALSSQQSP
jgi:hypothetical protein